VRVGWGGGSDAFGKDRKKKIPKEYVLSLFGSSGKSFLE
jgi:hypothetical protein